VTEETLIEAAAEELATVMGALLDTTGTAAPAPPAGEPLQAAPPTPDEALDWGDPAPPPTAPRRLPTIDAPPAAEPTVAAPPPEPAPEPEQQRVFDYDDDLDAEPGPPPVKEPSRFSFRYLVDDE
jgi:hypothetical protein